MHHDQARRRGQGGEQQDGHRGRETKGAGGMA
jgi:hypothetical protein